MSGQTPDTMTNGHSDSNIPPLSYGWVNNHINDGVVKRRDDLTHLRQTASPQTPGENNSTTLPPAGKACKSCKGCTKVIELRHPFLLHQSVPC